MSKDSKKGAYYLFVLLAKKKQAAGDSALETGTPRNAKPSFLWQLCLTGCLGSLNGTSGQSVHLLQKRGHSIRTVHRRHPCRSVLRRHSFRRNKQRRPAASSTKFLSVRSSSKPGFGHADHNSANGCVQACAKAWHSVAEPYISVNDNNLGPRAALENAKQTG